jgi:hypothetical protein
MRRREALARTRCSSRRDELTCKAYSHTFTLNAGAGRIC